MITGELRNRIDSIWDMFWSNGMTNPLTVIEQITYLMFLKILDNCELRRDSDDAAPIFDEAHQCCRWSIFRSYAPDAMFRNMTERVFPFIREELHAERETAFAHYMKDAYFLIPSARVLSRVVTALDNLDLQNRDMMGDVYEYLLSRLLQSGANGQFRTPRHIIRMMVELMQPTPSDTLCDPAMGSAGFLCAAAQYVHEHHADALKQPQVRAHFTSSMFSGFDTDRTMLRIGSMNMLLHGVDAPSITWMDSLSCDNTHREEYSLILANPPFTGSLDKETVSADLLSVASTKKTELLFMSLFLQMLQVGGRCASIIPDGVLFGSTKAHKALRRELVTQHRLEAVISMPCGVFRPYANVSTAILIFQKTGCGGTDSVWFYDMKADGFSLDDKRSPIAANDIPDIIERFHHLEAETERKRTDRSFLVPVQEIEENDFDLSIIRYQDTGFIPVAYPQSDQILNEIRTLEDEIQTGLRELEAMLN